MTTRPNPVTHADMVRLDAQRAARWPPRITRALEQLRRADDRTARPGGGEPGPRGKNTISDPTGTIVTTDEDRTVVEARADRYALTRAILERDRAARTIERILDTWAPDRGNTDDDAAWCRNHRHHGRTEPRADDGSLNCRWCADIIRAYGKAPTIALIRLHDQGARIDEATYLRLLGVKAKAKAS